MLSLLFIALAGVFKACKDIVNFRYYVSVFRHLHKPQWFNPKNSWKNKHYWFNGNKVLNWLIRYPFVFVTDAWHFFGGLRSLSIIMAIVMYESVFDNMLIMIALLWLCHSVVFTLFYDYLLIFDYYRKAMKNFNELRKKLRLGKWLTIIILNTIFAVIIVNIPLQQPFDLLKLVPFAIYAGIIIYGFMKAIKNIQ